MSSKEGERQNYGSGNTSQESGGSGGQRDMLELLSITDAAVKALNKSSGSQRSTGSHSSNRSGSAASGIQTSNRSNSSPRGMPASTGHSPASDHSGNSGRSQRSQKDEVSRDSGVVSKTQSTSVRKPPEPMEIMAPHDRSSDESTTASDILIRSTLDKSGRGEGSFAEVAEPKVNSNSSISSKCSRSSYGMNNFNTSGPQKVKISKKHLKKIKSPYEDVSPRDSESSDGKVPSELLGKPSSRSGGSSDDSKSKLQGRTTSSRGPSQSSSLHSNKSGSQGEKFTSSSKDGNRGEQFSANMDKETLDVDKFKKSAEKPFTDVNIDAKKSGMSAINGAVTKVTAGMITKQATTSEVREMANWVGQQVSSAPKYRVERHTPNKPAKNDKLLAQDGIPEKRNLLQDLDDSIEIITANGNDSSGGTSQPEIVTIQERIVTISAQNSLSPSSSLGEEPVSKATVPTVSVHSAGYKLRDDRGLQQEKCLDDSPCIPPALARQFRRDDDEDDDIDKIKKARDSKWFSKQTTGQGLRQGAVVNGVEAADKPKDVDIEISDFKLSEQQRLAKMSFAKRQGGPVRRVVKPHIISHDNKTGSTSNAGEKKPQSGQIQSSDQVLTAAAAASAAVAATQPFLKAQHEMETRMAELVKKLDDLQRGKETAGTESERVRHLEKQLAQMTEHRIEYMESLQAQQIAMQAKLLSLSREPSSQQSRYPRSSSPETHIHIHKSAGNKAFSKTTVVRQQDKGEYSDNFHKYNALEESESLSPLDTPAPRARAPKPTIYDTSDIDLSVRSRSKKASPKARSRSPKHRSPQPRLKSPVKEKQDRGILQQILASTISPEPGLKKGLQAPPHYNRPSQVCDSPNVKKARELVEDLSLIEDQVKDLVSEKDIWKPSPKESILQDVEPVKDNKPEGPCPLDKYLELPERDVSSPYKSVPDLFSSKLNAPVPQNFKDAQNILQQVQKNRGFLEANLESVLRGRQDVAVFSALETLYLDSNQQERQNIQKMVDNRIAKLRREVEREITDDVVLAEVKKTKDTRVPGAVKVPEPAPTKPAGRYGTRGRLHEPKIKPVEPRVVKIEPKKPAVKRSGPPVGKENYPQRTATRSPPKKTKSIFEDENRMTQIYGKAGYQKGRTTVKDPYLHFQNTSRQKPQRPVGVLDPPAGGKQVMSSKTQTTGGGVKQFYFNPSTGTYIPIANTGPSMIDGQLIQMAVPLGGPRMDTGLTRTDPVQRHVTPGARQVAQVTAASNVAMVTVGVDEEEQRRVKPSPELGKQVLPAVDIDTDISELSEMTEEEVAPPVHMASPARKAKKQVQIMSPHGSPGKSPTKQLSTETQNQATVPDEIVVKEENSSNSASNQLVAIATAQGSNSDDTRADEEEDVEEEVEEVEGLELPGYQPSNVPEEEYHGPVFPPKQPSADRLLTADRIAEDIRRRDVLQNNAVEWIEQELMARMISEMYPERTEREPARDLSHVYSEMSEDSVVQEDQQQSMFVMDSIGQRGLQLFVDAGVPVDNFLVQQLVHEVLKEKVQGMLGERRDQEGITDNKVKTSDEPEWEEPSISEALSELQVRTQQVLTPEPTPRGSPRPSPRRHGYSPARTPVASPPPTHQQQIVMEPTVVAEPAPPPAAVAPPPQPVLQQQPPQQQQFPVYQEPDSEPESSASYDIQAELQRLAGKLAPSVDASASLHSRHDIVTPPMTPRPEPETLEQYRQLSPPIPSPRQTVKDEMMMSQRVVPAASSRSPERSQGSSPKSASSPHVEVEEEEPLDQPKPVIFTVAETQTEAVKSRSPSPSQQHSRSRTPSESTCTESSSISESFNENISEGQWLINKSDGEVADFPINEGAVRENLMKLAHKNVNVSSASTWKDADDIDLDDASRSEGEFLYNYKHTEFPPESDPVLNLLSKLQGAAPQLGLYDMTNRQVTDVLNSTGRSEGEVLMVSAQQQQQQQQQLQAQQFSSGVTRPKKRGDSQKPFRSSERRSPSPQQKQATPFRTQSPTRVSFEGPLNDERPVSPTRGILKRSTSPLRDEVPVRDTAGRPTGRITPGGRQPQGRGSGMISAGGRTSPLKSSLRRPPQVIKSNTLPESRTSGPRLVNVRGSSEDYRDSLDNQGSLYGSNQMSRSMTPDQINVEALLQSGYMSQSFSQSEPMGGRQSGQSSLRSSYDVRGSRNSVNTRSLGYSYGTEGSLTESELQRLASGGTGRLDVLMPGTGGFEESDLSEIDITEGGNTT